MHRDAAVGQSACICFKSPRLLACSSRAGFLLGSGLGRNRACMLANAPGRGRASPWGVLSQCGGTALSRYDRSLIENRLLVGFVSQKRCHSRRFEGLFTASCLSVSPASFPVRSAEV